MTKKKAQCYTAAFLSETVQMKDVQPKYWLSGEYPSGMHVRFSLQGERICVGRSGDISLMESSVSRNHAVLTWNGDAWRVTDVGSRNGTFVNGIGIQQKLIVPGDVVRFGRVSLKLVNPDDDDAADEEVTRAVTMEMIGEMNLSAGSSFGASDLVGRSDALKCAMRIAARAAKSDATILLFGESGTGKELFARLVWGESNRSGKKFLPVHSGAIEPSLLASALFGHEKGAFTGADRQRKGLFEEADGGTIFLDEIGEINSETQVKLLRVLQEGEFMRVGGTEPIKVDVRVICATNRNLAEAVREGRFRADLYYRLNVIQIDLPPLRERVGDIEDLVNHYVKLLGGPQRSVSDEAMLRLSRYSWPGNVRELRNVIERMVVLSENDVLDVGDLPKEITESSGSPSVSVRTGGVSLKDAEKDAILAALTECRGNKKLAASKLKISRSTLYEKIKEYGLENV